MKITFRNCEGMKKENGKWATVGFFATRDEAIANGATKCKPRYNKGA